MPESPQLREQLRSLAIPREQRPGERRKATAAGRGTSTTTWILLVGLLALGGYLAWEKLEPRLHASRGAADPAPAVRLLKVAAQPASASIPALTATGKIVSDHRVAVATKVSGQIVELLFEQGDYVEAQQVLARIESEGPRARRDEAAANLERARANLEFQKFNLERTTRLHEQQQASDMELAEARRAHDQAVAEVAAAEAILAYAKKILRDCEVRAPIAGVILERSVEVGEFVAAEGGRGAMANSQFGTIADMTRLRVEVDVSELDIHRLRPGMPCIVIPDAYKERRFHGHVMWLDPGANYAKATVQVKVRIEDPDPALRVEGAAQVQFVSDDAVATAPANAGIWIPRSACRIGSDARSGQVFAVVDGRFRVTPVTVGRQDDQRVEILDGLREGQEIAADALDRISDGQPVPPRSGR